MLIRELFIENQQNDDTGVIEAPHNLGDVLRIRRRVEVGMSAGDDQLLLDLLRCLSRETVLSDPEFNRDRGLSLECRAKLLRDLSLAEVIATV